MSEEEKTLIFAKHFVGDDEGVFVMSKKEVRILLNIIENSVSKDKIRAKIEYLLDILRKHKKDLDYEPWSTYKISGNILFDLVFFLEDLLEE